MEYSQLKLKKNTYEDLIKDEKKKGKSVIVLQFTYLKEKDTIPTLKAYAMKKQHQKVDGDSPVNLTFVDDPPKPYSNNEFPPGGEQVLGDLQVLISEIEEIIENANPKPHHYDHLLFSPIFLEGHICFEVTVVPTEVSILGKVSAVANPSPPRGAL